jgi:molybdate transport system substrate-binding protein
MTGSLIANRGAAIGRRTLALMLPAAAAGIGSARADEYVAPDVVVFCEPTLQHALGEVAALWRRRSGAPVRIFAAPTALLLEQVGHGIRSDIIIGEGDAAAATALQRRLVKPETRFGGWRNHLVVAQRGAASTAAELSRASNLVTLAGAGSIALVDPPVAASGVYSQQALDALGLWDELQGHALGVVDTGEAAFLLDDGKARLAVVYVTDVAAYSGLAIVARFPNDAYPAIVYWGAQTQQVRSPRADDFASFLRQPEARERLRKAGLEVAQ